MWFVALLLLLLGALSLSAAQNETLATLPLMMMGDVAGGAPCFNDTTCFGEMTEPHGICNADLVPPSCQCYDAFAGARCEYTRKSKRTTFILSILLGPYGTDRFFLGYTSLGIGKLILSVLLCGVPCVPICCALFRRKKPAAPAKRASYAAPCALFFLAYAGVLVWWLHDWIQILRDALPDANGVQLFDDMSAASM